jgi:import inner membrane translocase subunit TIM22
MGPTETRNSFRQAGTILRSIGRKTLWGAALGGVFCYTEATLENYRGTHDIWNGMAAGAAAGALFGLPRPMPQPIAWPLAFAATAAVADIVGEYIPLAMRTFK